MNHIIHDPDEWETVVESRPCTGCREEPVFEPDRTYHRKVCTGHCNGMSGCYLRRRSDEDIAKIKARRLNHIENNILAQAATIQALRRMRGETS